MMRRFFAFALFAAFAAGVSFAALADPAVAERSISIVASEVPGAVKLVFGAASSQDTLYLHVGYGTTDGGDTPAGWANFVYVADITPDMTEYDCVLPSGWGTSVTHVRYFLTTEHVDYSIAYEYIEFKGNGQNGSYFLPKTKTGNGYIPIPSKTHIVADFTSTASRNMAIFCSRGTGGSPTFTQMCMGGTGFRFDCGRQNTSTYQSQQISVSVNKRCLVESGPNLTVNWDDGSGTADSNLPDGTNFTTTAELYLFATHAAGSTLFDNRACGLARSVRIYESDMGVYGKSTLVHEYLPVQDPDTGKGALYDTIDREFVFPTTSGSSSNGCEFKVPHTYEYETAGSTETFAFVPRTLEVVFVASEGGTTKATLAVSAGNLVSEAIVLAFGAYDYGAELSAWPTNEILSVVLPAAQQLEFEMPSCWNTAKYSSARFFLVHCSPITLQVMESVKGDRSAYIDLGRKGVLGHMVQITASASGTGALFGARESSTENCFSVKAASGGSRDLYLDYSDYTLSRGNYSRPDTQDWITFLNSPTERCVYSGTDTSGAAVSHGAHWNEYQNYGNKVKKDFTTPENLRLFDSYNDSEYGRFDNSVKSFYLWHIDGAETNLVMDLVPVRKETTKEAGFYDHVSKKLFTNAAGSGKFTAEGSVQESFITPTVFRPESVAQTMTRPVFASEVRTSIDNGTLKIKVVVPEGQTWYASVAYGKTDMGRDPAAWGANTIAGGSGTGSGEVVCALPADWRKTMKAIRVFLSSVAPMMSYEYLRGDGKAYLDLGRKGVFGDMVALKYRHNSGSVGNSVFGARRPGEEAGKSDNFSVQAGGNVYVDYSDNDDSRATATSVNTGDTTTWLSVISSPVLRQIWLGNTSKNKNDKVVTKPFETADNLCLFNIGGFGGNILNACIKDFELRHIEGSVTNDVMRLVPVYAADINKYGMFDEVRGKLLLNAASSGAFSVTDAAETGARAYPAYKCSGVSDPVNRGGLILLLR